MATQLIDQIEKPEQDQLIKLFASIETDPLPTDEPLSVDTMLPLAVNTDCSSLVAELALEKPTRKVRQSSRDRRAARNNEHAAHKYRLVNLQQAHIDSALANISRMEQLIQRVQRNIVSGDRRAILLKRYQLLQDGYVLYLAKVRTLQQKEMSKLSTW